MKPGVRALGVAESYVGRDRSDASDRRSTLGGVVVRASRVVDGFSFGTCTVGGSDATDAVAALFDRLDREDVRYVIVGGVALAWYNLLDLHALRDATERPVLAVTFEDSPGLEAAIRDSFDGAERDRRLDAYRALPERQPVFVNGERVFVRAVGCEASEARDVVRAFTPEGGRPEPLRVARLAARAADGLRTG